MTKKLLTLAMAAIMVLGSGAPALAAENSTTENGYYNETIYITPENITLPMNIDETGIALGQVQQTVYVKENFDSNGKLLESRLMTETEAAEYKMEVVERSNKGEIPAVSPNGTRSFPADDSTSEGELTITLTVYDRGGNEYSGYADADWSNGIWLLPDGESRPHEGKDFLAITWGGNGQIKQSSNSISGIYQFDQGNISFSKAESNSYAGYCWQFDESKWSFLTRYYADYMDANVVVKKTYAASKNKETAMRMTYIHTYEKVSGSIDFSIDSSGLAAAGVSLSSTPDQWQIEVDISGLLY